MPRESDYETRRIGRDTFAVFHRRSNRPMPHTVNERKHAEKWLRDLVADLNEQGTLKCGCAAYTASGRLIISHVGLDCWPTPRNLSVLVLRNPQRFIQKAKERCLATTKCC